MMGYPEAITIIGCLFAIAFGVIGVKKAQYQNKFCESHDNILKGVEEFKSLTKAIIVAFSDIARIKQAVISLTVDMTKDTPEGIEKREKIIEAMMSRHV